MSTINYEIRSLSAEELNSDALLEETTALINDAFVVAEQGLWKPGWQRTSKAQVEQWFRSGELFLAINTAAVDVPVIAGAVRIHNLPMNPSVASFGPLTVSPALRKAGIGKRLIEFSESFAASRGFTAIQLELLIAPSSQAAPQKEYLKAYYGRLGYSYARVIPASDIVPQQMMKDLMTEDTTFYIMQKELTPPNN